MRNSPDWVAYALHLTTIAEPGTRFGYCSPNFHLLSAAIATTTKLTTLDYARGRLFGPLGIPWWWKTAMGVLERVTQSTSMLWESRILIWI